MKLMHLLLLCACLLCGMVRAQTLEDLFEQYSEERLPELSDMVTELFEKPIAINEITADSIEHLDFLDADQRAALLELHRRKAPHIDVDDLSSVLDLPVSVVRLLFRTDRPPALSIEPNIRLRARTTADGLQQDSRVILADHFWQSAIIQEKDAGEKNVTDYIAGFVTFHNRSDRLKLVAGDFALSAACGLVFAGMFGNPALGVSMAPLRFIQPSLQPFASTMENSALRGLAAAWYDTTWSLVLFASASRRDAVLDSTGAVLSRPDHGYHRTPYELAARHTLLETTRGFVAHKLVSRHLAIGLTFLAVRYNKTILNTDPVRRHFAFRGRRQKVGSIYFMLRTNHGFMTWGEFALAPTGRAYTVQVRQTSDHAEWEGAVWYSQPGFINPYGALPGKRLAETDNSIGAYLMMRMNTAYGRVAVYALRQRRLWRTHTYPMPTLQEEAGIWWHGRTADRLSIRLRLRLRRQPRLEPNWRFSQQRPTDVIVEGDRLQARLEVISLPTQKFNYRLRLEWTRQLAPRHRHGRGLAISHEIRWHALPLWSAGLRLTHYAVTDFDMRIYQFESLFPDRLLPVALSGEGQRLFTYLRTNLSSNFRLSAFFGLDSRESRLYRHGGLAIEFR